jgi:hypothetical protein
MRRCTVLAALIAAAALSLAPAGLFAQEGEEEEAPDINYITVTKIRMPATQERQKAMEWIDKVMAPGRPARSERSVVPGRYAQLGIELEGRAHHGRVR